MKVGILSDTHGNLHNTEKALAILRERGAEKIIHCGDITTSTVVMLFAGWDVTFVFGNMDLNRDELNAAAQSIGAARLQFRRDIEADGVLIGVVHGNDQSVLYAMAISGKYTYVCHGHTHQRRNDFWSPYSVRVINPGALGGSQPQTRSVCLLDTSADTIEFIEFPEMF